MTKIIAISYMIAVRKSICCRKSLHIVFADEKEKYDPTAFRDAILQGLAEAGDDLEQVSTVAPLSSVNRRIMICRSLYHRSVNPSIVARISQP